MDTSRVGRKGRRYPLVGGDYETDNNEKICGDLAKHNYADDADDAKQLWNFGIMLINDPLTPHTLSLPLSLSPPWGTLGHTGVAVAG